MGTTQVRRSSQPIRRDAIDDEDAIYDTRPHTSTRRYRPGASSTKGVAAPSKPGKPGHSDVQDSLSSGVRRRSLTTAPPRTNGVVSSAITTIRTEELARLRRSPWLYVVGGMLIMVLFILAIISFSAWWTNMQNDLRYGYPRTYQFDAVVGHEDSAAHPTHFILLNLHGHIEIIEMPGGNAALTRIYSGPTLYGPNSDLIPVTGEVRAVKGGKPELILHVQGQQIIFVNDGKTFHLQSS